MIVEMRSRDTLGQQALGAFSTLTLLLLVATPCGSPAQTTNRAVRVFFTAWDSTGLPVTNLSADEIQAFENQKEQKVLRLARGQEVPLRLALLFDTSGSRKNQLFGAEEKPAKDFVQQILRANDKALVAEFSEEGYVVAELTENVSDLHSAIGVAMRRGPRGSSALFGTIAGVCTKKLAPEAGRRIIVAITDGNDNASRLSLEQTLQAALQCESTIYFVAIELSHSGGRPDRLLRKSIEVAKRIAFETGGLSLTVKKEEEFAPAFARIASAIQNEYLLEYPQPDNRGGVRQVLVATTRPGITLVAPRSYSRK